MVLAVQTGNVNHFPRAFDNKPHVGGHQVRRLLLHDADDAFAPCNLNDASAVRL